MNFSIPSRVAQILFAVPFVFFGINHLMAGSNMAGMVPIPAGTFWIYFTGIAQLLAAFAFLANIKVRLAGYLLALYLLILVLAIHLPGAVQGNELSSTMLVKDIGLMAGALLVGNLHPAVKRVAPQA